MQLDTATMENSMKVSLNLKRTTIWLSNPTHGHIPGENHNSKRYVQLSVHCSSIYIDRTMEATWTFTDGGIDKEDVVHLHNGLSLSHRKGWNRAICRDVSGPRDCHRQLTKSEREKQILPINAYMWNLEKWYRWIYLQSRNRVTDVEHKLMDTDGSGGKWDKLGDWDLYMLLWIKHN